MRKVNMILNTDSYKFSMFKQCPPGTEHVYSYIESRGGKWDKTVNFGIQAFLKEYLSTPITNAEIIQAKIVAEAHGVPFNHDGWDYVMRTHNGMFPVKIKAAPEGLVIPTHNVLATIVNTDPKCFWLTTYLETALLRGIWYPTTVATNSWACKQVILKYLEKTGDPASISFKLHDFGARGGSSYETVALGGMAHLVNFMGTDTVAGVLAASQYYDAPVSGFSIPAMEHSTVTSWGKEHEVDAYRNMLKCYAKNGSIVAAVSDSYDIYNACESLWGGSLKDEVIASGATIVIRPDSGHPATVVLKCLQILDSKFGSVVNEKGYKVLNNVRVIQGDGINYTSIGEILENVTKNGYSADNVAFGMGGGLLQQLDRDTLKFAQKCSAVKINGEWRDVFKDPVTDSGKRSKKGRLTLQHSVTGEYSTVPLTAETEKTDVLQIVFENGVLYNNTTFEEVRSRSNQG